MYKAMTTLHNLIDGDVFVVCVIGLSAAYVLLTLIFYKKIGPKMPATPTWAAFVVIDVLASAYVLTALWGAL